MLISKRISWKTLAGATKTVISFAICPLVHLIQLLNIFIGRDNNLNNKEGHLKLFFYAINKAHPRTFNTIPEMRGRFMLAIKRLRERFRKIRKSKEKQVSAYCQSTTQSTTKQQSKQISRKRPRRCRESDSDTSDSDT